MASVAVLAMWIAATATGQAGAQRNSDHNSSEPCSNAQDAESRQRCERPWENSEQNFSILTEADNCGKGRGGCGDVDRRAARPPRPPYWIGHHYSGL